MNRLVCFIANDGFLIVDYTKIAYVRQGANISFVVRKTPRFLKRKLARLLCIFGREDKNSISL